MHTKAIYWFAASCLALASVPASSYTGDSFSRHYVSGGVGVDSRNAMQALAPDYNLRLRFSEGREYLGKIDVMIEDSQDQLLLQDRSEGPWFFVDLPPGNYRVIASDGRHTIDKLVRVGLSPNDVDFVWP